MGWMAGTDHARRRRHWGIENSCHYIIHWCFNEDRSRISKGHGPERFWLSISALEVGKGLMPPPALMSRAPFRGLPFLAGGFSPRQIGHRLNLIHSRVLGLSQSVRMPTPRHGDCAGRPFSVPAPGFPALAVRLTRIYAGSFRG